MFCNKCGYAIKPDDLFCKRCGAKLEESCDTVTDVSSNQSIKNADSLHIKAVHNDLVDFPNTNENFDANTIHSPIHGTAAHSKKRKWIRLSIIAIILIIAGIMSSSYFTRNEAKPLSVDDFKEIMINEGFTVIETSQEDKEYYMDGQYKLNEYLILMNNGDIFITFYECGSEELASKLFDDLTQTSFSNKMGEVKTSTKTFTNWKISTSAANLDGSTVCFVNVNIGKAMISFIDVSTTYPEEIYELVKSLGYQI